MIKVFLVDDHPFVREGLKTFLGTHPDISVVGEAACGEELCRALLPLRPDVAVVDLKLPGMGGIEITRFIRQNCPSTRVLILSSFSDDEEVLDAMDAGASGYLMKDQPPQRLMEAILRIMEGKPVLAPHFSAKHSERTQRQKQILDVLSAKEKEILEDLVKGFSNKEIAAAHFITETTVKSHISSILRKMDVKDRTQAVIMAIQNRLTEGLRP